MIPGDKNAELYKTGRASYVDPVTGKMVYLDRVGPEGSNLTSMDLGNPAAIDNSAAPQSIDSLVNSLIKSMSPSNRGTGNQPFLSSLVDMAPKIADYYTPPEQTSDKYFQDLLASITGPSSVEDALKLVESQGLGAELSEIDRGTRANVASAKMDFFDRGIAGPGRGSDIEANAIAQLMAGGERTKSATRSDVLKTQLGRQSEKEKAKSAALGLQYQTGAARDTQERGIAASSAQTQAQLMSQLLGQEYGGFITQREGMLSRESASSQNYLNQILNYALKTGELSQQDAQFYSKLISDENTAAADRTASYDRALLGTRGKDKDILDQIQQVTSIGKDAMSIYRGY